MQIGAAKLEHMKAQVKVPKRKTLKQIQREANTWKAHSKDRKQWGSPVIDLVQMAEEASQQLMDDWFNHPMYDELFGGNNG